jgi:predicted nucleotidyltransferase
MSVVQKIDQFGLNTQDYEILKSGFGLLEIRPLRVFIFGSRSRGSFKKYSDIDLFVESDSKINNKDLNKVKEYFEESKLPYKVDLVLQQTVYEPYHLQIESEKKLIF